MRVRPMKRLRKIAAWWCLCALALSATAQTAREASATIGSNSPLAYKASDKELRGRVISEDGSPLPFGFVTLMPGGNSVTPTPNTQVPIQPDGTFRFPDIGPGAYRVRFQQGWYQSHYFPTTERLYRPGEFVELRLNRGGVITGLVVDESGQPFVDVAVRATQVRDRNGRRLTANANDRTARTDDRGIYRISGLSPGAYHVGVGAVLGTPGDSFRDADVIERAPTYYPSAAFESAGEVTVGAGREVGGIDLRIRPDAGHTIKGTVVSPFPLLRRENTALVEIARVSDGAQIAVHNIAIDGGGPFTIAHVPDGDYFAWAEFTSASGRAVSRPVAVKVKGADVSGLAFEFFLYGSIAGGIKLVESGTVPSGGTCSDPAASAAEFALIARSIASTLSDRVIANQYQSGLVVQPDGTFESKPVAPGPFRLDIDFPNARYFVRSITRANSAGTLMNLRGTGVMVASGEKVKDVLLTIADNAAAISGSIAPKKADARVGLSRLHLIPAESTAADDLLRYRELEVGADGKFAFANLAPGSYWLYAEPLPPDALADPQRPLTAWDAAARLKLRRAAEAGKVGVELKPCQRGDNFTVGLPAKRP